MVKLTFEFDKAEVTQAGLTEDELLTEVRDYAKKNNISETSYGVFEKDGDNALCLLMIIADQFLTNNQENLNYLTYLELDDEDEKENCIDSFKRWMMKKSGN